MTYETTIIDDYKDPEIHGLFLPIKNSYSLYGFSVNTPTLHYPNSPRPSVKIKTNDLLDEISIMAKVRRCEKQEAYWFITSIFKGL